MRRKKRKRRLTESELKEIREWMASALQGRKPSVRAIARRYGVNQPSVIKSLGGWKGIQRGRPDKQKKTAFSRILGQGGYPINIEGYTTDIDVDKIKP